VWLRDWRFEGKDPGLSLFTLANAKLPDIGICGDVFEIGAVDTDFLERVYELMCPCGRKMGMDWRITPRQFVSRGDVRVDPIPRADVFIGISSIEHIGLGHYEHDPVDPYGDIKVVQRIRENLKLGGFFYFDVPYAPEGYYQLGTKCRVYDDRALSERFGEHEVLGYTRPSAKEWIEKPVKNCDEGRPFYYVACLIRA
jgi:hypothetical protein